MDLNACDEPIDDANRIAEAKASSISFKTKACFSRRVGNGKLVM
jgi:hypothetical protein